MKCNKCGAEMRDNSTFCTHCGAQGSDIVLPELKSGTEEMRLDTFNSAQIEPYSEPAAPAVAAEPEKKEKKKPNKKLIILLIIAAAVLIIAAVLGAVIISRGGERTVPSLSGSTDYSAAVQNGETVSQHSEKETVRRYLSAIQSGDMNAIASMYNAGYCVSQGYDRMEYAERVTPPGFIGKEISRFEVTELSDDKDYLSELDFSDLKCATVNLTVDGCDEIIYIYLVKSDGGWSVLYPSSKKFSDFE